MTSFETFAIVFLITVNTTTLVLVLLAVGYGFRVPIYRRNAKLDSTSEPNDEDSNVAKQKRIADIVEKTTRYGNEDVEVDEISADVDTEELLTAIQHRVTGTIS
jgi:hypothetical protein